MSRVIDTTPDTLLGIDIFRMLDAGARGQIARHCSASRYPAHHLVVRHEDASTDVYFVVSGRVRVTIYSRTGKEVSFRDMGAGELFGDLSAIDGRPRTANVVTLEESMLISMRASAFKQVLMDHPPVAMMVMEQLAGLIRALSERVVEFSTLGVKNRIHAELLRLANQSEREGDTVRIDDPPTHADLASRVSTHREAVTKELSRLEKAGIIARRKTGGIVVNDIARLRRMVEDVKEPTD
ncbi:MAG: Crp/Fnr family transcriptional regulator [Gammaproteobacteria bacterium]|nr:Crp/Fnr family transcriptional regulator [Gammaproteobacteria bacterium]